MIISNRGYTIKNLHFEPNFVILDRGYHMKNLHFEPNLVILNSIMYSIKNLHFLVKFWVQNHHSKHEIDSPHDCKSLWFFFTFFYLFFCHFSKKSYLSSMISKFLWCYMLLVFWADYISILKCFKKYYNRYFHTFWLHVGGKSLFLSHFFPFLKIRKTKIVHITDQK